MIKYIFTIIFFFTICSTNQAGENFNFKKIEHYMLNTNEKIVYDRLTADGYTKEATAAVMGVVGGESAFKTFKEIGYSTTSNDRIRAIFGDRVSMYSDSALTSLKQNDENFFNAVYGGMHGNAANEGWKYVGRGFNGITFKGNYIAYNNKINAKYKTNIDIVSNPELLQDPKVAAMALSVYMEKVKDIKELEPAFQEAFRQNAGPYYSFAYYASLNNPVATQGIPLKRKKAIEYYSKIGGGTTAKATLFFFCFDCSNNRVLVSKTIQDKTEIENLNSFLITLNNK
jgi:predicted chitinase